MRPNATRVESSLRSVKLHANTLQLNVAPHDAHMPAEVLRSDAVARPGNEDNTAMSSQQAAAEGLILFSASASLQFRGVGASHLANRQLIDALQECSLPTHDARVATLVVKT